VKVRSRPRIVVIFNRDFEGAEADPENKAREDVRGVAENILRILNGAGFEAAGLGVTNDVGAAMATLSEMKPDAVFNLCESIHGDSRFESLMPLLMDLANIPFTGSCSFGLALALRKEKVKDMLRGCEVPVARGYLASSAAQCAQPGLVFPLIVKPAREDASIGISSASVVFDPAMLASRVAYVVETYRQPALVEEYIEGREIYVSVLERVEQEPLVFPFFEIDFSDMPPDRPKIVSFEGKWVEKSVEYKGTRPMRCEDLPEATRDLVAATALAAFRALGLRDYARMDIRLSPDGIPYVIDVNPNCDLSDLAGGYSRAAKAAGLSYRELILRIVGLALARRDSQRSIANLPAPASLSSQDEGPSGARARAHAPSPRGG
jgi:D-alanine-D-alanine ligase